MSPEHIPDDVGSGEIAVQSLSPRIHSAIIQETSAGKAELPESPGDYRSTGRPRLFGPDLKVIQVDIEPEEIGRNRRADVGLPGDVKVVLRQLGWALEELGNPKADPAWAATLVGIPYGIAAKLAPPERPVVVITGDGSFGLGAMEFDTAVRHGVPIVCVIGNDTAWGQVKHGQEIAFGPALERAFASGLPACVNVPTDPSAVGCVRRNRSAPGGTRWPSLSIPNRHPLRDGPQ